MKPKTLRTVADAVHIVLAVCAVAIVVVILALAACGGPRDQSYYDQRTKFLLEVQEKGRRGDLILCPNGEVWHHLAGLTVQRAPGLPPHSTDTLEALYQPGMKLIRYQPTAMWAEYAHKYLAK
ncbi:MAG: hypothetical protein ACM3NH_01805 [Candidatus Saccharibacteria bacterium]